MTDPIEQRLREAATAASMNTDMPGLAGLRRRAQRRRATLVGAPLAVAGLLFAGVIGLQPQDRDRVTTQVATDGAEQPLVTFTMRPIRTGDAPASQEAVQACLGLPGVVEPLNVSLSSPGSYTVPVRGADNIDAFDACVSQLAGLEVLRSDEPTPEAVTEARRRWNAAGSADYTYTLKYQCFCPGGTYRITVVGGTAVGIDELQAGNPREADLMMRSIDDLFDLVERPPAGVVSVRATYDERYGYPTRIDVDSRAEAIDDEYIYLISEYQPTTKPAQTPARSASSAPPATTQPARPAPPATTQPARPAPASTPTQEAPASPTTTASREIVINDTSSMITLFCADCPREGVKIEASGRAAFERVNSDYVRFERPDGTATCIGYGSSTADEDAPRKDNELYVSQGGNCRDDWGRPS